MENTDRRSAGSRSGKRATTFQPRLPCERRRDPCQRPGISQRRCGGTRGCVSSRACSARSTPITPLARGQAWAGSASQGASSSTRGMTVAITATKPTPGQPAAATRNTRASGVRHHGDAPASLGQASRAAWWQAPTARTCHSWTALMPRLYFTLRTIAQTVPALRLRVTCRWWRRERVRSGSGSAGLSQWAERVLSSAMTKLIRCLD